MIAPNFKDVLAKLISDNVLNMKSHDEGNYDVDRLDYILRDSIYSGERLEDYSHEQYERKYARVDENGNIMRNKDGSIIVLDDDKDMQTPKKRIDVYEKSSLRAIENFLETRVQAYKNMYFSELTQVSDSLVGTFVQCLLDNKEDGVAKELKNFIKLLKEKDVDIDISEYLRWDDIRFYANCIDVAENSNNQYLRAFSGMSIPNLSALMSLTFSHLDLKNARDDSFKSLSQFDIQFIQKIKELIYSNTNVSKMLKSMEYYQNNCLICTNRQYIENLKKSLGNMISYSNATVYGYKESIPIYIKDKDGRVFMLHQHPERTCDWEVRKEEISVAFTAIPFLKLQGFSDEQIEDIKKHFMPQFPGNPGPKNNCQNKKPKVNMSPVRVDSRIEDYFEI